MLQRAALGCDRRSCVLFVLDYIEAASRRVDFVLSRRAVRFLFRFCLGCGCGLLRFQSQRFGSQVRDAKRSSVFVGLCEFRETFPATGFFVSAVSFGDDWRLGLLKSGSGFLLFGGCLAP